MTTTRIVFENVGKVFPGRGGAADLVALDGVDLEIAAGEFLVVVGPSGCGKSTLLDLLAGLTRPSSGRVLLDGEPVTGPGLDRGIVFQQYALLPWRTARGNVEFGLEATGVPRRVFTGIRMAGAVSILVLVAAEMVGAKAGLGYLINSAQFNFAIPDMYAGIVTIAVLGVLFNQLLVTVERRLGAWRLS